jgi:mRNA interferase RelE/StbE
LEYAVEITARALRDLKRVERRPEYATLRATIDALGSEPRPHGYRKLVERPGYRVRVGAFRIIYDIDDTVRIVTVERVGRRDHVYD